MTSLPIVATAAAPIISWMPADMISVPGDRQRRLHSKDSHTELAASIAESGLIQPIVIDLDSKNQVELVAGERRLRAMRELIKAGQQIRLCDGQTQAGCVPVICLRDQPRSVRFRIELEENIRRLDITWQERIGAIKRLADMVREERPDATMLQIAEAATGVAGLNVSELKSKLTIADWMNLPQVAGAPTEQEAKKRLVQHLEDSVKAQMALGALTELGAAEGTQRASRHTLLHGDSRMLLATLPAKFDIVLTDPPYGVGADKQFRDVANRGRAAITHNYEDSANTMTDLFQWLPAALTAVTKPQAHLYLFCDIRFWPKWESLFIAAGWDVCNRPLIWNKGRGPAGSADIWPMRCYEAVLYAVRGRRPTQGKLAGDVLTYEPVAQRKHAAQKPAALYADLLSRSALLGDHVLDPFCGSGTIFEVAEVAGIAATGIEKDAASVALAQRRLAGEKEEDWQR